MPRYLIEKLPEGLTSIISGDLPLEVVPPYGHGDYVISVISEDSTNVLVSESAETPQNIAPPTISGAPQVGQTLTAIPGQWAAVDAVSGQWHRDSAPITGATGLTYVATAEDDLTTLSYIEEATLGGLTANVQSSGVLIRYIAPSQAGELLDEIFDAYTGIELIPTASVFTGENLSYTVPAINGISIDSATGLLSVNTDVATGDREIIVTAENSGGSAETSLNVTVEEEALVYSPAEGDVSTLWEPRYRAPTDTADTLTYSNGRLIWPGTQGPNNAEREMYALKRIGDTYLSSLADADITFSFIHSNNPAGVALALRASGNTNTENLYWLWSPLGTLKLFRTIAGSESLVAAAPAGNEATSGVEYTMRLRAEGSSFKAKQWPSASAEPAGWEIEVTDTSIPAGGEFGIFRVHSRQTEILGVTVEPIGEMAPLLIANAPQFWTLTAPVGEQSQAIDFSDVIVGDATEMTLAGANVPAHTWNGKVLTVEANDTLEAADFTVSAVNGPLAQLGGDAFINIEAVAAPPNLAADLTSFETSMVVEVDRPYPITDFSQHHSGGLWPYTYTVISKPSWITVEHNGMAWGIAPTSPVASEAISVRVTDTRGDTIDLTTTIEVIARRDRTGATIPTGSDIPSFLSSNGAAPGDVYVLEASGSYTWLNRSQVPAGTQANPIIITGPASAVVDGSPTDEDGGDYQGNPVGSFAGGIITEGFSIRAVGETTHSQVSFGITNSAAGVHCYHYDHLLEGWRDNSIDLNNPPEGELWEITDTNDPEHAFTNNGSATGTTGRHIIFDGLTIQKIRNGFGNSIGQHEGGIFRTHCQWYRQDGGVSGRTNGLVVHQVTIGRPEGNYFDTEHQDLWQLFSEKTPACRNIILDSCFFSCESRDQNVQGLHYDQDAWAHDAILDYTFMTERPIVRDTVVLASSQVGFLHERFFDGLIEGCAILNHPESSQTGTSIRMRTPSQVSVSGTLCNAVGPAKMEWKGLLNSPKGPGWSSVITETNNEELILTGEALTNIFPNWSNSTLVFEDPRAAVRNGQPASSARFWIDPASAWSTAHTDVGPKWLRDGQVG